MERLPAEWMVCRHGSGTEIPRFRKDVAILYVQKGHLKLLLGGSLSVKACFRNGTCPPAVDTGSCDHEMPVLGKGSAFEGFAAHSSKLARNLKRGPLKRTVFIKDPFFKFHVYLRVSRIRGT